jgi:hypothetical protein
MSEPTERPGADAWAEASAADIAAERARRDEQRRAGREPVGSAAEELRRLAEAVGGVITDGLAGITGTPRSGPAAGLGEAVRGLGGGLADLLGAALGRTEPDAEEERAQAATSPADDAAPADDAPSGTAPKDRATAPRTSPLDLLGDAVNGLRERHPEVVAHLAAAGGELLAAYRSVVGESERRWTSGESGPGRGGERPGAAGPGEAGGSGTDRGARGPGGGSGEPPAAGFSPTEHIDLD